MDIDIGIDLDVEFDIDLATRAFCPTGPGGGVDPTCSPGKSGAFRGQPANPDGADTYEQYRTGDGGWTPERQALHDEIVRDILGTATPVDNPTSYLMGGGPASGKSTVAAKAGHPENMVAVDSDAIKARLPEYGQRVAAGDTSAAAFMHEESSYLSKRVMAEAVAGNYNVLLDGTGDSGIDALEKKISTMRGAGRPVRATYVTVPTEVAVERNIARAQRSGRLPPLTYVRECHAAVSRTVPQAIERGLFDEFELYDNSARTPVHVASARGSALTVHNTGLWQAFLDKGT